MPRSVRRWNGTSGCGAQRSQSMKTGIKQSPITSGAMMCAGPGLTLAASECERHKDQGEHCDEKKNADKV